jgi:hypothetical protein
VSTPLPLCAETAWWLTGWLRGLIPTDDLLDGVPVNLDLAADLRASGATAVGLALPAPGDPLGLGGPPEFNLAAQTAGEALVSDSDVGLVPGEIHEGYVRWDRFVAVRRQVPDLGEADRGLRRQVLETSHRLAELEVAKWRPEVADEVMALGRPLDMAPPAGVPPRCAELAVRSARCLAIVRLAGTDDGAAVSAYEMEARAEALRPLDAAARRGLVAACSPEVWPEL